MSERMSPADFAFLARESRTAPQHVGGLAVFARPAAGFDYERLVQLLEERISLAPRYRQRVRMVPGHLANPMWVDDPAFDITYHVRRSALPRPGTDEQLLEFCSRIESRLLDRARPLWEMYLIEGLSDGRIAILTKTHEAMVDETSGIDLAQVILDAAPAPRRTVGAIWMPGPEPSSFDLVRDALMVLVRRPIAVADTARAAARDIGTTMSRATSVVGGAAVAGRALLHRPPSSPLHVELGEQRRLSIARTRLDDYRRLRAAFGGTVNDAVLAVVAGALRGWLLARGEPLSAATSIRALVPVSVTDDPGPVPAGAAGGALGIDDDAAIGPIGPICPLGPGGTGVGAQRRNHVRPLLVDLPVGEPDPVLRLAQLRYAMSTHKASGQAVGADTLAALSGFAPPTLHALGARAASGLTRRMFRLVITNVPGPQVPLYAAGARMTEMFPILPLAEGQAVSIALTSYDGGMYYGVNGDRDAMPDVALLADLIEESLAELVVAIEVDARSRRPAPSPGRATSRSVSAAPLGDTRTIDPHRTRPTESDRRTRWPSGPGDDT